MKYTGANLFSAAIVIALAIPSIAVAQPGAMQGRGPITFEQYDADGDGLVSAEEFYAARGERMAERATEGRQMRNAPAAPPFEEFDADGDGYLTQDELLAGQRAQMERRMAERGAMGGPGGGGMRPGMSGGRGPGMGPGGRGGMAPPPPPEFDDIDLDGDGIITREEFEQHRSQRGRRQ